MDENERRITLNNGCVINVVANDMGTVISLMSETEPDKAIGRIVYSKPTGKTICAEVYDHESKYQCTECGAKYTSDEAGEYCSECGHDEVFLIEEELPDGPEDWMFDVMEEGDPQGWAEDNLRKIETENAIKEYEQNAEE